MFLPEYRIDDSCFCVFSIKIVNFMIDQLWTCKLISFLWSVTNLLALKSLLGCGSVVQAYLNKGDDRNLAAH